jgi:hypothetical protein
LIVDNFSFKKDTVGTVTIHIDNKVANTYNTEFHRTRQSSRFKWNLQNS